MSEKMRTQVAIIGAGPAGLLLAHCLKAAGIESVVLERQTEDRVVSRIRAGLLERTTVDLLDRLDLGQRMHTEGIPDSGINLADGERMFRIDFEALTGKQMLFYGQTEITKDLVAAAKARDLKIVWEAMEVALNDLESDTPKVTYNKDGKSFEIEAKFVAGCDGYHGVSRRAIPSWPAFEVERSYPFGWLGILADVPPCHRENIYSNHDRGFALATLRSVTRSRYYIQVPLTDTVDDWPDEKLWDELELRIGGLSEHPIIRGPALEKSIAPLRSFVSQRMRDGRLLLAGDAAHIVPPTGAKGLNLAASDIIYLSEALLAYFRSGEEERILGYEEKALSRVWRAQRFSWQLTNLLHRFPDNGPFERRMQIAEIENIQKSLATQTAISEDYVGLPL